MQGWDKTYCLQFVEKDFDTIHFFGDKTFEVRNVPLPICLKLCTVPDALFAIAADFEETTQASCASRYWWIMLISAATGSRVLQSAEWMLLEIRCKRCLPSRTARGTDLADVERVSCV